MTQTVRAPKTEEEVVHPLGCFPALVQHSSKHPGQARPGSISHDGNGGREIPNCPPLQEASCLITAFLPPQELPGSRDNTSSLNGRSATVTVGKRITTFSVCCGGGDAATTPTATLLEGQRLG